MKLDVLHALRDPGTAYAFAVEQTIAPQDVSGEEVAFDPVQLSGHLTANEDGSVVVEGSLTTTAHAHCAKCLSPASCPVTGDFRETGAGTSLRAYGGRWDRGRRPGAGCLRSFGAPSLAGDEGDGGSVDLEPA